LHLLLTCCVLPASAATNLAWFYRPWQTEDGLPEHTLVGVEQTPDGYLWIATHLSLSRFDGKRFQEFTPAMTAGPQAAQIRAMLRDRLGRLWLAKDLGTVLCVDKGIVSQTLTLKSASPNSQFRAMKEDAQGNVWISDTSGAVFRIQNTESQTFGTIDSPPTSKVSFGFRKPAERAFSGTDASPLCSQSGSSPHESPGRAKAASGCVPAQNCFASRKVKHQRR
jgi:ligand-binding sensor domain-containing protein